MTEIWKTIPISGLTHYQASNLGNIRNTSWRSPGQIRELTQCVGKGGYLMVCLTSDKGKQRNYWVHRLVAAAFIDNPEGLEQVNHKDENRTNNRADNLEWVTSKQNNNYGSRNKRVSNSKRNTNCKKVYQYDKQGNLLKIWESVHEVNRQTGFDIAFLARCCRGKRSAAYGYIWRYEKGADTNDPSDNEGNGGTDGNPAETRKQSGTSD